MQKATNIKGVKNISENKVCKSVVVMVRATK
jgi:hypothetical protein